jgi:hypothetical protein
MKYMAALITGWALVLTPLIVSAQIRGRFVVSNRDTAKASIQYAVMPDINAGTHLNGLGANVTAVKTLLERKGFDLIADAGTTARYYFSYLGIPGGSFALRQQIGCSYSFGKRCVVPLYTYPKQRRHALSYYFAGYYSTDRTSQFSGGLRYRYLCPDLEINYIFENDFLAFQKLDQYRTFAFELNAKKITVDKSNGLGAGVILWTGTTKGLGFLHKGENYDLTGQYGAGYAHGIAYIKFYYNNLGLSLGYDSEKIRTFVQGNFHDLIDDGRIPPLDRRDRIFIQLSVFNPVTLY